MSDLSQRIVETEKVLRGLPLVDLGIQYSFANKIRSAKTYLLPIKIHHNQIEGLYVNPNGDLESSPIGFSLEEENLQNTNFYQPSYEGSIIKILQSSNKIYLPLKITPFQMSEDHLPVLGVKGAQGLFPLLYIMDVGQEVLYRGLYQNTEGKVNEYTTSGDIKMDQNVREIIGDMSQGKVHRINSQIQREREKTKQKSKIEVISGDIDWRNPQTIISYLDQYVIGQQEAKEAVSVAFSNYMIKMTNQELQIEKNNVIFMGGTGSGKTFMATKLAERADIHFVSTEVSTKTGEGYKGNNLSSTFSEFREKTNEEAPAGIFLIDEIDKISSGRETGFSDAIQNNLVVWADDKGSMIHFDGNQSNTKPYKPLNTKNIFFIAAGAFAEDRDDNTLEKIIMERERGGKTVSGFGAQLKTSERDPRLIHRIKAEDLVNYGLKPELIGRFPIRAIFNELTTEDKVQILTESKDSILISYQNICEIKGIKLDLYEEIPRIIAEACPEGTGARELKATCQALFQPIFLKPERFVDNHGELHITPELAQEILSGNYRPQIQKKN